MAATKKRTKTVKVTLEKARALLVQLGLPTATKMKAAKVLGKLQSLDAQDDTADPGKYKRLYARIVDANAQGIDIVIDDAAEPEKPKARKASTKKSTGKSNNSKTPKKANTKKAPASSGEGKDQFGCRIGANPAKMNEALVKAKKTGLTTAEVAEAAGVSNSFASSHMQTLRKKGFIETEDGRHRVA